MKKHDLDFLSNPSRQSSVAILVILMKFFGTILRQAWPLIIIFLFKNSDAREAYLSYVIMGIAFLSMLASIISYFKFYYYVEGEELIIEKGVIQSKRLNVPFERIQTVNFEQNIIHRIFNVVSLEIDTAGSKGKEFSITALSKEQAEAIRNYLLSQKRKIVTTEEEVVEMEPEENLLLQLSPLDLLKVGVAQNHFRMMGLILVSFFGFYQFFEDIIGDQLEARIKNWFDASFDASWPFFLLTFFSFLLIVSFLLTLVRTIVRYYDLRFLKTSLGFKVIAGLLTKKEQSANINKIQLIHWDTNPLMEYFKLFSLTLSQAASMSITKKQSIFVPGSYDAQLTAVRKTYFPEEGLLDFEAHGISPLIIWRRVLYLGIVPVAIIMSLRFVLGETIDFPLLLWILIVGIASYLYQRKWAYFVSEKGIRLSRGIIGRRETLLKWYKIQSVKISQGIYQRRKNLATVDLYTAAGSVRIPYIELEKANALQNFILYRIESSQREWM
ncbi:MAG: PH domain-containing protein [Saprospiraceae bacterium]